MKRTQLLTYIGASLVVVGFIAVAIVTVTKSQDTNVTADAACSTTGKNYEVTIKNDVVSPNEIDAKRCDTLTITNEDSKERLLAFGYHSHHVAYDGIQEKTLVEGDSATVTLKDTGEFHFHDHHQDEVEGFFTVTN